jgi:hypothetical protein
MEKRKRPQSEDARRKIEADFEEIHGRLREVEKVYNPQKLNLHFDALQRADAGLYKELLILTREGLEKVKSHGDYFSNHALYDDGMFWYDLFLVISAAALSIVRNGKKTNIPQNVVMELIENLVEISTYSTVHTGDIVKRNYDALGNTLIAFFSEEILELVHKRKKALSSEKAKELIEYSIKSVIELAKKDNSK